MARDRIRLVDWFMLALAIVSVAMLVYETWGDPTPEQTRQILLADYIIIGIFAIEFSLRWARDDRPKTFVLRNWYELLGMIPVAHPAIRGFRLFRIIRIVVILSRFGRAADRAFGEEFTYRLIARFKNVIADAISGIVTLRVLDETAAVMAKGDYTRNMADAMEEHGDEMLAIVVEKVKDDPQLGAVRHVPFFEDMVGLTSKVSQRVMIDLLRDERMDTIVKQIIAKNIAQIQASVKANEVAQAATRAQPTPQA
ncbi:MAG: ion transporter [Thermoplasmatota archaeon]